MHTTRLQPRLSRLPAFVTLILPLATLLPVFAPLSGQQGERPITFTDLMQIRQAEQPSISPDGRWVALTAAPDRGDPEVVVREVGGPGAHSVPGASRPVISSDGAWVAMRLNPSLEAVETLGEDERPRRGLALLETATGALTTFEDVSSFAFSADGGTLV